MVETVLIVTIALLPSLISLVLMRRQERRAQTRLQEALNAATVLSFRRLHHPLSAEYSSGESKRYFLGDTTCRFNAHSAFLRCAVNPSGSCKDCFYYEAIEGNAAVSQSSIVPDRPNL